MCGEQGTAPQPRGQQLWCVPLPPSSAQGWRWGRQCGCGWEAEGLEEGVQWGYNLGWKGDALRMLRMQLGIQLGWNRNGIGLHLGEKLGCGGMELGCTGD